MALTIWMADWEFECCGEPFAIASAVIWNVRPPDTDWLSAVVGDERAETVDFNEEHHDDEHTRELTLTGTATSIGAVRCAYGPTAKPNVLYPVAGSGTVTSIARAGGRPANHGASRFAGYLIEVEGQVSPAN